MQGYEKCDDLDSKIAYILGLLTNKISELNKTPSLEGLLYKISNDSSPQLRNFGNLLKRILNSSVSDQIAPLSLNEDVLRKKSIEEYPNFEMIPSFQLSQRFRPKNFRDVTKIDKKKFPNWNLRQEVEQKLEIEEKKQTSGTSSASRGLLNRSMYKYNQLIGSSSGASQSTTTTSHLSNSPQIVREIQTTFSDTKSRRMLFASQSTKESSKESKIKLVELDDVEKAKKERRKQSLSQQHQQNININSTNNQSPSIASNIIPNYTTNEETNTSSSPGLSNPTMSPMQSTESFPIPKVAKYLGPEDILHGIGETKHFAEESMEVLNREISRILSFSKNLSSWDKEAILMFFKGYTENPSDPSTESHIILLNDTHVSNDGEDGKQTIGKLYIELNFSNGDYHLYQS
ncbi:MAG: hypothetical protein MHPSP_002516 [Paramarteilia canceri]